MLTGDLVRVRGSKDRIIPLYLNRNSEQWLEAAESLLAIFSRVQALTSRQQLVSAGDFYGRRFASGVVCPALRVRSARFTDAAG